MTRTFRLPTYLLWLFRVGGIFLVLLSLMRLAFFLFFNNQGNSLGSLGPSFWLGFRFDLRAVSLICLPLLLLGAIPWLHPFRNPRAGRGWIVYFGVMAFLVVFFYVVDFAHYAYLSQRLNASVLHYLQDAGISANMVWQSYPVIRLLLLILALTAAMAWLIRRTYLRLSVSHEPVFGRLRGGAAVLCFLLMAGFIFGRFNQYPLRWSDAFSTGNDYRANLALTPFESFFNTLQFRSAGYDEKKLKQYFPLLASQLGLQQNNYPNFHRPLLADSLATPRPVNIVLVICESFSAYKSSMWGNPLNTTPFFDSLSQRSLFYDRCFTPSYGTARGVWATLTGIPDVEIAKTSSRNPLAVDQHILINDFKEYARYYFIGGSPSWANIQGLLRNNIHDLKLYDQESFESPRLDVWGISDKNLFLESNKVLAAEKQPFFAVIQTADNHRPYTIPAEDTDFEVRAPSEDSLNRFGFADQVSYTDKLKEYNAFRYTDFTFRKFMDAAAKEAYFKNTLFVFIGDHGIPGDVGEMFPPAWTNQQLTAMHVPLLFYFPGSQQANRIGTICSQLDVLPTIAGWCNRDLSNSGLGRNLLDTSAKPSYAFIFNPDKRQIGMVMDPYLYLQNIESGKSEVVPIAASAPLPPPPETREHMINLTNGYYEAARYLLLNNKKQPKPEGNGNE